MDVYLKEAMLLVEEVTDPEQRFVALHSITQALAVNDPEEALDAIQALDPSVEPTAISALFILLYGYHRQERDRRAAEQLLDMLAEVLPDMASEQRDSLQTIAAMTPAEFRKKQVVVPGEAERLQKIEESKQREQQLIQDEAPCVLVNRECLIRVGRGDADSIPRAKRLAEGNVVAQDGLTFLIFSCHLHRGDVEAAEKALADVLSPMERIQALTLMSMYRAQSGALLS